MENRFAGLAGPRSGEEMRCPSCARLLVLRSGPAITAHFAHRPRQSCRNRPGRPRSSPIRLEQLTLFELEPLVAAPSADPHAPSAEPGFGEPAGGRTAPPVSRRRRRRRAWLPRLIRWIKAKSR
ncbi:MAG: Competence protein CoiA-like family [Actinomycetota bacterium]|nr:Competence protein CoiA-like family [Actinomycetota bacterium]